MAKSKILLPQEMIHELQDSQRRLADILSELDYADQIGLDTKEFRQIQSESAQRVGKLLEIYGPGFSPAT